MCIPEPARQSWLSSSSRVIPWLVKYGCARSVVTKVPRFCWARKLTLVVTAHLFAICHFAINWSDHASLSCLRFPHPKFVPLCRDKEASACRYGLLSFQSTFLFEWWLIYRDSRRFCFVVSAHAHRVMVRPRSLVKMYSIPEKGNDQDTNICPAR